MSEGTQPADELEVREQEQVELDTSKSAPADRATDGPFDSSEVPSMRPYVDFGGIKIQPREGLQLRLEVDEKAKRVLAVTVDYQGSLLQLQAFSAPKTTGLWHSIRREIMQQMSAQQAESSEEQGPLGPELVLRTPVAEAQGGGTRVARLIAVDGPRWTLRGTVLGKAAEDAEAREKILEIFRSTVVVRGDGPMPPSELLQLQVPAGAQGVSSSATSAQGSTSA